MEAYLIYENSDKTEGKGSMSFVTAFTNFDDAVKFVSGRAGLWGRSYPLEKHFDCFWTMNDHDIKKIEVHKSLEESKEWNKRILKMNAMNKLTPEEKEVLGLK